MQDYKREWSIEVKGEGFMEETAAFMWVQTQGQIDWKILKMKEFQLNVLGPSGNRREKHESV